MRKYMLFGAMALACAGAQAQFSAEPGYTGTTTKSMDEGDSLKAPAAAIRGIVGNESSPKLSLEGMLATGLGDWTPTVTGASVAGLKLKIANFIGMYIKPTLKLNDSVEVFARFGAVESKLKASSGVESASEKHSSPSYGAGLSYSIHPSYSIGADFMQHLSKDGTKVNGWSVGVGFRF